jgi:hypothetical protein
MVPQSITSEATVHRETNGKPPGNLVPRFANPVPHYLEDHSAAVGLLSPGFTALVELREIEATLLSDYLEESQIDAVKAGIKKAARVYGERALVKTQTDRINKRTGLRSQAFKDLKEAEEWLDRP